MNAADALMGIFGMKRMHARVRHKAGVMNKLERAYADRLELLRLGGKIRAWAFDAEKLRLADKTFYSPDFRVVDADGFVEFHEVKGFWEDDARVKVKVAASLHPYQFVAAQCKRGVWTFERFGEFEG